MFRILLIVGLLLAGIQQSLARGNIELFETGAEVGATMWSGEAVMDAGQPGDDPTTADNTPSYCKSSDCKAVIGTAFLGTANGAQIPDTLKPLRRRSLATHLEPRPPNS